MTTLYRTVTIESAEQAEALPVGTIAQDKPDDAPAVGVCIKGSDGHWYGAADPWPWPSDQMIGDTALVPIEAEEEFTAMGTDDGEHWIAHVGPEGITGAREAAEQYTKRFGGFIARRYRTPWEETP